MNDDVLIILNERETLKEHLALELQEHLEQRELAADRIKPGKDLLKILRTRSPRVLVLDYLLGDFGTGLDILSGLAEFDESVRPSVLFWTDEPSVNVAVEAMKLGAKDYVEIGSSRSIEKLLQAVEQALQRRTERRAGKRSSSRSKPKSSLIYQAPSSRPCLAQAASAASRSTSPLVLLGESGIGRSSLGRHVHSLRNRAGSLYEFDMDLWTGSLDEIFGSAVNARLVPRLSSGSTVILDHAEFASTECLEQYERIGAARIQKAPEDEKPLLIVGTSDIDIAHSWARVADAQIIEIPPLQERHEDFLPMIQLFTREISSIGGSHSYDFSAQAIEQLTQLEWKDNIRQFRAALYELCTTPKKLLLEMYTDRLESDNDEELILAMMEESRDRWMRHRSKRVFVPDAFVAHAALEQASHNVRIAAAILGTGVAQVKEAISQNRREGTNA